MMVKEMNNVIKNAVDKFNDKAYFLDLPKTNTNQHPLNNDHIEASNVLTKFIKENVL